MNSSGKSGAAGVPALSVKRKIKPLMKRVGLTNQEVAGMRFFTRQVKATLFTTH
jgi:hypothetical protein